MRYAAENRDGTVTLNNMLSIISRHNLEEKGFPFPLQRVQVSNPKHYTSTLILHRTAQSCFFLFASMHWQHILGLQKYNSQNTQLFIFSCKLTF